MIDKGTLTDWEKEALSFKVDIEDMNEATPVLELIDRLLKTIEELMGLEPIDSDSEGSL
jgi:hypothetical protein